MLTIHSNTNLYISPVANITKDNAKISDIEILSNIEKYYQSEQILPLNGGQFASLEFNQKLDAKMQNIGQVSEVQMKVAKQFLDEMQKSVMISFYKENQEFIEKAIEAQKI